ncbi:site-specific integrase [Nonomuraea antri]|uniref:tyrosine-type recombinase/integrase n=1 Tax=Nonomuraea antri TaxID=2730852 RepID=UPI001F2038FD|nr:tyrosine-type recombinase/integrase [Nonomuraea antri]
MPFFAVLYFAGLRPEEAVKLHETNLTLPTDEGMWGEIHLTRAAPHAGKEWTDSGNSRDDRGLKHRAEGESRPVPCTPELVTILRTHLETSGVRTNGIVFHGIGGRELSTTTIRRTWDAARRTTFSSAEYSSPLAKRPYDLRHACLSTWLNAGVPAKQVAEWAGNSVKVLLSTYAKCLVGQDEVAMRRISEALRG